jgi:transcriptional regulator with XRE-family HTH domain
MEEAKRSTSMDREQSRRLGTWLRQRRHEVGLSTIQLAKRVNTTDATITRIEQGAFAAPDPHKLSRIAEALDLSLADVYAMAGYAVPDDLPSFQPYLRRKYRGLPPKAVAELERYFGELAARYGIDPAGPAPGQDETSERPPRKK